VSKDSAFGQYVKVTDNDAVLAVNPDGSINTNISDPTNPAYKQGVDSVGRAKVKLTDSTGLIDADVTTTHELRVETVQKPDTISNAQIVNSLNEPLETTSVWSKRSIVHDPVTADLLERILIELQRMRVAIDEMSDLDTTNLSEID